ncbi:MAG: hypothetical protein HKO86_06565 [Gammaproteobacteria bacterium]|nr:hypothetical protein [Gammaproteobacteria bacterium]NNL07369.1 hypothetical protein [Gammaproteobacteria bacterium]
MHRDNVAIIGCGAGGPVVASVAAQTGFKVALVEKEKQLDRVVAGHTERGFLRLVVKKGRIAGANATGHHAGEVIHERVLAIQEKMKLVIMTGLVLAFPGYSQLDRRAASQHYRDSLFSPLSRKLVWILSRWLR